MSRYSAYDGEATGLPVCAGAVRLRLSAVDRLFWVVRWVFGLAGAVVVLWIGAAFLATPASAAALAPAAAVQQSLLKGGASNRQSDGGDGGGDSGSGGDSGGEKKEKSEKKKDKKSDKSEKKREVGQVREEVEKSDKSEKKYEKSGQVREEV